MEARDHRSGSKRRHIRDLFQRRRALPLRQGPDGLPVRHQETNSPAPEGCGQEKQEVENGGGSEHSHLQRRQHTDPGRRPAHPQASGNVHRQAWRRRQPERRHLRAPQGDHRQFHRRVRHGLRQAGPDRHRGQPRTGARLRTRHPPRFSGKGRQRAQHRRQVRRQGIPEIRRPERRRHQRAWARPKRRTARSWNSLRTR